MKGRKNAGVCRGVTETKRGSREGRTILPRLGFLSQTNQQRKEVERERGRERKVAREALREQRKEQKKQNISDPRRERREKKGKEGKGGGGAEMVRTVLHQTTSTQRLPQTLVCHNTAMASLVSVLAAAALAATPSLGFGLSLGHGFGLDFVVLQAKLVGVVTLASAGLFHLCHKLQQAFKPFVQLPFDPPVRVSKCHELGNIHSVQGSVEQGQHDASVLHSSGIFWLLTWLLTWLLLFCAVCGMAVAALARRSLPVLLFAKHFVAVLHSFTVRVVVVLRLVFRAVTDNLGWAVGRFVLLVASRCHSLRFLQTLAAVAAVTVVGSWRDGCKG